MKKTITNNYLEILKVFDNLNLNLKLEDYAMYTMKLLKEKKDLKTNKIFILTLIPLLKSNKVNIISHDFYSYKNHKIVIDNLEFNLLKTQVDILTLFKNIKSLKELLNCKNLDFLKIYLDYLILLDKKENNKDILKIQFTLSQNKIK